LFAFCFFESDEPLTQPFAHSFLGGNCKLYFETEDGVDEKPVLTCKKPNNRRNLKGKPTPEPKVYPHNKFGFECGCIHGEADLCPAEKINDHTVILKNCNLTADRMTWILLPVKDNEFLIENLKTKLCMEASPDDLTPVKMTTCNLDEPYQRFKLPEYADQFYQIPV